MMVVHALQLWPMAGSVCSSLAPQTEQVRLWTLSASQVGAVVTAHSPQLWPLAGMVAPPPSQLPQVLQ